MTAPGGAVAAAAAASVAPAPAAPTAVSPTLKSTHLTSHESSATTAAPSSAPLRPPSSRSGNGRPRRRKEASQTRFVGLHRSTLPGDEAAAAAAAAGAASGGGAAGSAPKCSAGCPLPLSPLPPLPSPPPLPTSASLFRAASGGGTARLASLTNRQQRKLTNGVAGRSRHAASVDRSAARGETARQTPEPRALPPRDGHTPQAFGDILRAAPTTPTAVLPPPTAAASSAALPPAAPPPPPEASPAAAPPIYSARDHASLVAEPLCEPFSPFAPAALLLPAMPLPSPPPPPITPLRMGPGGTSFTPPPAAVTAAFNPSFFGAGNVPARSHRHPSLDRNGWYTRVWSGTRGPRQHAAAVGDCEGHLEGFDSLFGSRTRQGACATGERTMSKTREQCFKTKLCHFFLRERCTRGENCLFAHDNSELRHTLDLSKTKICVKWRRGECSLDSSQCAYAHGESDLRVVASTVRAASSELGKTGPPAPVMYTQGASSGALYAATARAQSDASSGSSGAPRGAPLHPGLQREFGGKAAGYPATEAGPYEGTGMIPLLSPVSALAGPAAPAAGPFYVRDARTGAIFSVQAAAPAVAGAGRSGTADYGAYFVPTVMVQYAAPQGYDAGGSGSVQPPPAPAPPPTFPLGTPVYLPAGASPVCCDAAAEQH